VLIGLVKSQGLRLTHRVQVRINTTALNNALPVVIGFAVANEYMVFCFKTKMVNKK
jgi:hypothetical protein